ncbi:MAG TPA: glycine betaine ABC transporter substrate-binding protein, partial [Egibacteraceae bacterium]|nr:glycine betaine ABC transporter substrate-binding protein [Egibacteraceae bacterium]
MATGAAGLALAALVAVACVPGRTQPRPNVVVGVGSSTEQRVLAALTLLSLDRAGVSAELRTGLDGTVGLRREALRANVDLYWDYTGAAWGLGLGQQAPPADPLESYQRVRRADEPNGLVWMEPSQANATLALFIRHADVDRLSRPDLTGLSTVLSGGDERVCADPDFVRRPGGLEALTQVYAIELGADDVVPAAEPDAIAAAAAGRCFTAVATATSGVARAAGLVPVADDLMVFPAFVVTPVARAQALETTPRIVTALDPVTRALDTATLAELNAAAEAGAAPAALAEAFLS